MDTYYVLAFYIFTPIADPHEEVRRHHEFFETRDIRSRIYISKDGINAQMSAIEPHAIEYMEWMKADQRFEGIDFKIHTHKEHAFPKITVKYKEQLVALDRECDPQQGGQHLSASEWKQMLEQREEDTILIDVRNDYEWVIGHFEGALKPALDTFRKFPEYVDALKKDYNPSTTKVMMYCTGGIRCELYSALMKQEGFETVYQLDGGVIKYGQQEGSDHWKGKLFVFDDRLSIPIAQDGKEELISACKHCGSASSVYYNCANMDCNKLFLCCAECAKNHQGSCCTQCQGAERLRPYQEGDARPKPFRKWYHYRSVKGK
ncbi:MAG: rhodanese-related sulfurtransferase [Chlamydiae bacterium]|nr:rhodanese-related sulfurtransferase [Chlamydiota bacterium]